MNPIIKINKLIIIVILSLQFMATEVSASTTQGGSLKLTSIGYALSDRDAPGSTQYGGLTGLSGRYYFESRGETGFDFQLHYQLNSQYQTGGALASLGNLLGSGTVNDQTRLMNLTQTLYKTTDMTVVQRLDRLNIGYTGNKLVWRLGRQAIGWGNGYLFQVMDFFNPTPPGSLDSDYKIGDDMFYMQWLTDRGHDWQLVYVWRRDDISGQLESDEMTLAWKFHWLTEGGDYDLLFARHYGQTMFALAMAKNIGKLILRADYLQHDVTDRGDYLYLLNTDYSWECFKRNCHFFIEYFHNNAAQANIDLATLPTSTIYPRLLHGELYVMGQDYLGMGLNTQLSALSSMNLTLMYNISDHSSFLIYSYLYDFKENSQFQAGFMLSQGGANTEFGGLLDTTIPDYQPTANVIFVQYAHYF
jgi:hypothetical protein